MPLDGDRAWQHPWFRVALLIRAICETRWDAGTWPTIKAELRKAIEMQSKLARAPWWN